MATHEGSATIEGQPGRVALGLVALAVLVLALAARLGTRTLLPSGPGGATEFATLDPDAHYHMRRVDRALVEGRVESSDPLLTGEQWPDGGAPIPWPGGATRLLVLATELGGVPEGADARRAWIERVVGSSALVPSALLAALVAWLAGRRARSLTAAAIAGVAVALAPASLRYGHLGMGDHHALATLLGVAALAALESTLRPSQGPPLRRPMLGAVLVAAGLSVWLPLLALPIALALVGLLHPQLDARRAVASTLALVAVLTVPLAWGSPWPADRLLEPSWGVPWLIAVLAAAVALRCAPVRLAGPAWLALLGAGGLIGSLQGLLQEVSRGLAWVTGTDRFMAGIGESRSPMASAVDLPGLAAWTGPALWLALPALFAARGLGPWRWASLGLLVAGALQARFTEAAVPLLAVVAGVGSVELARTYQPRLLRALVGVPLALAAASPGGWLEGLTDPRTEASPLLSWQRGVREAAAWLRGRGEGAVLAQWDLGHLLEWVGERRSVATNFGAYLGREPFESPWRALASTGSEAVEEMQRWGATHLLWTSRWRRNEEPAVTTLELDALDESTLFARIERLEDLPGQLRLVYESPDALRDRAYARDGAPPPCARILERVSGALLELAAAPGAELVLDLRLGIEGVTQDLRLTLRSTADAEGVVRLRVPYATDTLMGAVRVVGEPRWACAGRSGTVVIPEAAVRSGERLLLGG